MAASGDVEWREHRDALSSPAARSSWGLQQSSLAAASSQPAPRRLSLRSVSPMRASREASREDGGAGQSVWYVCTVCVCACYALVVFVVA